jgi:hypothetical protein
MDDTWYALDKRAQVMWKLLTTDGVGNAIENDIKTARTTARAKNKKTKDKKKEGGKSGRANGQNVPNSGPASSSEDVEDQNGQQEELDSE